jgi:hypothetical protein
VYSRFLFFLTTFLPSNANRKVSLSDLMTISSPSTSSASVDGSEESSLCDRCNAMVMFPQVVSLSSIYSLSSKVTSVKCKMCGLCYCHPCSNVGDFKNPCGAGGRHLFIPLDDLIYPPITCTPPPFSQSQRSLSSLSPSHLPSSSSSNSLFPSSLPLRTPSVSPLRSFNSIPDVTISPVSASHPDCSRCGQEKEGDRLCGTCAEYFCLGCSQLNALKNPCINGAKHLFTSSIFSPPLAANVSSTSLCHLDSVATTKRDLSTNSESKAISSHSSQDEFPSLPNHPFDSRLSLSPSFSQSLESSLSPVLPVSPVTPLSPDPMSPVSVTSPTSPTSSFGSIDYGEFLSPFFYSFLTFFDLQSGWSS